MTELKEQILDEVRRIIEEETTEVIQINCDNGQKVDISVDNINELIKNEVAKAVTFYMYKNKINSEQAMQVIELSTQKLASEYVLTISKIKHIVKDIIIHILSKNLNQVKSEKYQSETK